MSWRPTELTVQQAKGDPALGELLSVMDEMLASRLSEAATQTYRHAFVESLILRKILEEVLNDARVSSRAAERILAGKLLTATDADRELDAFLSECASEAETVMAEIQGEWQSEMTSALSIRPDPEASPTPAHVSPLPAGSNNFVLAALIDQQPGTGRIV
jgi:hypothetical protein